jgi:hypothetical protein
LVWRLQTSWPNPLSKKDLNFTSSRCESVVRIEISVSVAIRRNFIWNVRWPWGLPAGYGFLTGYARREPLAKCTSLFQPLYLCTNWKICHRTLWSESWIIDPWMIHRQNVAWL